MLLVTASGSVRLVDAHGQLRSETKLDLMPTAGAVSGDVTGGSEHEIVAVDVFGSLYCFAADGRRLWKHPRESNATSYRLPVLADLDRDGKQEILISDSRGKLVVINGDGSPRMEIAVTTYRLSPPAVADVDGDGTPEIFFGTEDKELFALTANGHFLWKQSVPARLGRTLPMVADLDRDGRAEVFVGSAFNQAGAGLFALDARSGKTLWKADSQLQVYQSAIAADVNGDGKAEVLFADKNTRVYCVDASGKRLWSTQVSGRGIFYQLAVLDKLVFAVARNDALHVLDGATGKLIESVALEGGGAWPAALIRFRGENEYRLIAPGGSGKLTAFRVRTTGHAVPSFAVKAHGARILPATPPDGLQVGVFMEWKPPERPRPVSVHQLDNPWTELEDSGRSATPNQLAVTMIGNERESLAAVVSNPHARASTLHIAMEPFRNGDRVVAAREMVEVREVLSVLPGSTGRITEDALPLLGEGQTLRLAPNETRKVWFTVRSAKLEPGDWKTQLRIGDIATTAAPTTVDFTVRVLPYRLPDRLTYRHNNWLSLSGIADDKLREATLRDALDHGTNVFLVPSISVKLDAEGNVIGEDTATHDKLVTRLKGQALFMVTGSVGLSWPAGMKPSSQLSAKALANGIRHYAQHMDKLGVPYEDYALYTQDEPGLMGDDDNFRAWMNTVKQIKAADPKMRIYANPAGGARAEFLAPMAHLIDIWQPDLHLVREQPAAFSALFSKATYWHYEAPADQRNLHPLGYYRMKPWVAFQLGMTGGGYWVYSYTDYWFFNRTLATEYGTVYPTPQGPVTTKRWEASRDGIEDFEILTAVKRLGATNPEAQRLLDEAVAFVTKGQDEVSDISRQLRPYTPNYAKWMDYRRRLVDLLTAR